jgi:hypothetical protein
VLHSDLPSLRDGNTSQPGDVDDAPPGRCAPEAVEQRALEAINARRLVGTTEVEERSRPRRAPELLQLELGASRKRAAFPGRK